MTRKEFIKTLTEGIVSGIKSEYRYGMITTTISFDDMHIDPEILVKDGMPDPSGWYLMFDIINHVLKDECATMTARYGASHFEAISLNQYKLISTIIDTTNVDDVQPFYDIFNKYENLMLQYITAISSQDIKLAIPALHKIVNHQHNANTVIDFGMIKCKSPAVIPAEQCFTAPFLYMITNLLFTIADYIRNAGLDQEQAFIFMNIKPFIEKTLVCSEIVPDKDAVNRVATMFVQYIICQTQLHQELALFQNSVYL